MHYDNNYFASIFQVVAVYILVYILDYTFFLKIRLDYHVWNLKFSCQLASLKINLVFVFLVFWHSILLGNRISFRFSRFCYYDSPSKHDK